MTSDRPKPATTLVVGLGNPLMGDDGLGLRALAQLEERWELPAGIELLDGGTWGMNLLPAIEEAERLLFLDAINGGVNPGAAVLLERGTLPKLFALKVSPHQIDLREVLALAEWRGTLPDDAAALGLQPSRVELGEGLSPAVEAGLDGLVDLAVQRLRSWGHDVRPRLEAIDA